jgi:hypothetical protein
MPKKKLDHGNLAARTAIASPRRGAKRLERVRKAEAAYTEAAKDYQDGVRLMAHGLRDMLKTSQGLLHIPASTQVVSQRAILTRASQWLAAQLFDACRTGDWFGTLRLHYSGKPKSRESFVSSEIQLVSWLLIMSGEKEQK